MQAPPLEHSELEDPWPFMPMEPAARGVVLLTTGAMNPIHRGHMAMLHAAADRLRAEGCHILRAYVSPSHDGYVQPKAIATGTFGLSAGFRLAVARLAVAEDPLLAVGAWEATQPGSWPDFPEVCEDLRRRVHASVYYVCGTDHAAKCGLFHSGLGEVGVVVVPRTDDPLPPPAQLAKRVFLASPAQGETAGFSSTEVRKALVHCDFDATSQFVSSAAAQFMLRPTAEQQAAYHGDYRKMGVQVGLPPLRSHALDGVRGRSAGSSGVRILGITGCSRSGKGWVSAGLQQAIADRGHAVTVVGQDSFWHQAVQVTVNGRAWRSEEEPECTDHAAFAKAIRDAAAKGGGTIVIAEGFQLVHSNEVTKQLDAILQIEMDREEARRRRCQPADPVANPNPLTRSEWNELAWPAHERYVAHSLTPLTSRIIKVKFPESVDDRDAIVSAVLGDVFGLAPSPAIRT